jgi:hypothetical protein
MLAVIETSSAEEARVGLVPDFMLTDHRSV